MKSKYQRDRYFFDKRIIKKALIKYGIMFLIGLPVLIVMNLYVFNNLSFLAATFADVGVLLAIVLICLIIYNKIESKQIQKKREQEERERQLAKAQRRAKKTNKNNNQKKSAEQETQKDNKE